jgi:hypothetical protein
MDQYDEDCYTAHITQVDGTIKVISKICMPSHPCQHICKMESGRSGILTGSQIIEWPGFEDLKYKDKKHFDYLKGDKKTVQQRRCTIL